MRKWLEKNKLTSDTCENVLFSMDDAFIDCCEYGNNNGEEFIRDLENLERGKYERNKI